MTLTFICSFFLWAVATPVPDSLSRPIPIRIFSVWNICYLVVMDQNLVDDNFSESGVNEDVPLRNTNNEGEKSYKCKQCKYTSSVKSNLSRHLKTHSGEKSNKCDQCDFASSRADVLRAHLKTHSGERSNKCSQCDYASSRAGHLRRHLKTHYGDNFLSTNSVES